MTEVLLLAEVQPSCTLGMWRCLDPRQRIVWVLGELFEISGDDAAYILDKS